MMLCFSSAIGILAGCNTNKEGRKEGTVFYFYPESNTYLDADNGLYYMLDQNKGWQETVQLSSAQEAALGTRVLITDPQKPVWKNNEQDRLLYSVALHTSPEVYQKNLYEDSINSLPKKIENKERKEIEEKEKTGLGKLLEKVFSKKDKKERR